jgi:hypothetical protein
LKEARIMDVFALVKLLDSQRYAIVKQAAERMLHEPLISECFPKLSAKRIRADIDADLTALNKAAALVAPAALLDRHAAPDAGPPMGRRCGLCARGSDGAD